MKQIQGFGMKKSKATKLALINKSRRRKAKLRGVIDKMVGFIPARGGSQGIKRKNVIMLAGYPLIAHSILTLKSIGIKDVYVSTNDEEIMAVARDYGAKVIIRPVEISRDISTIESAIAHFLRYVKCETVIMVQPTSPMLKTEEVQNGLVKFVIGSYDSVFSIVDTNDMLLWDENITPINYNPQNRGRRQTRECHTYIETGGFYIFKTEMFNEQLCRIGGKVGVSEVSFWTSFQLDTKVDYANISKLMGAKKR